MTFGVTVQCTPRNAGRACANYSYRSDEQHEGKHAVLHAHGAFTCTHSAGVHVHTCVVRSQLSPQGAFRLMSADGSWLLLLGSCMVCRIRTALQLHGL